MLKLKHILNKKIIAIRGHRERKNQKHIETAFLLFDDEKTIIEFEEQDTYDYHDSSHTAKEVVIWDNKDKWNEVMTNEKKYGNTNIRTFEHIPGVDW